MVRTIASADAPLLGYAGMLFLFGGCANAWVSTCLVTRRLHDIGRSGWWQLAPLAIVLAAATFAEPAIAAAVGIGEMGAEVAFIVAIATYLGFLGILGCTPSGGPNRFDAPVAADAF